MLLTPYMNVYLDESGNSGELGMQEVHLLSQPFFVLAAIGIPNSMVDIVRTKVDQMKKEHNILADELKSKALFQRKAPFILALIKYLHADGFPIFVESVYKKYFLATFLIETAILPQGRGMDTETLDASETPVDRPRIAEIVCNEVSDATFSALCEACTTRSKPTFEAYLDRVIAEFEMLSGRLKDAHYLLSHIKLTRQLYKHLLDRGEGDAHKRFLPEPDQLNKKSITLLPHIQCLNSICARAEKYRVDSCFLPLTFVHDEQREYSSALRDNFESFKRMPPLPPEISRLVPHLASEFSREASLDFQDSKNEPLIQIADIIAGVVSRILKQWNANETIRDEYWQVLRLLYSRPHKSAGVNLVMPHSSVDALQHRVDSVA